jgi:uncharacterized protein DUF5658
VNPSLDLNTAPLYFERRFISWPLHWRRGTNVKSQGKEGATGPMTPSSAVVLRFGAATALFWLSLTMAVEGRTGPTEEPPAPAFHEFTTESADPPEAPVPSRASKAPLDRPAMLGPMYLSFAALQALDIHSTLRAPDFGAREVNPLVGGLLASPAAFVATKAAVTAGLIYVTERLRRQHPRAAVLMMIGLNSAYAVVVTRNYVTEARAGNR